MNRSLIRLHPVVFAVAIVACWLLSLGPTVIAPLLVVGVFLADGLARLVWPLVRGAALVDLGAWLMLLPGIALGLGLGYEYGLASGLVGLAIYGLPGALALASRRRGVVVLAGVLAVLLGFASFFLLVPGAALLFVSVARSARRGAPPGGSIA